MVGAKEDQHDNKDDDHRSLMLDDPMDLTLDALNVCAEDSRAVQFEGLNLERIRDVFLRRGFEAKRSAQDLVRDTTQVCFIVVSRGTVLEKILRTTSARGCAVLSDLVTTYQIKSKANNGNADVLTLGRIASAFPKATVLLARDYMRFTLEGIPKFKLTMAYASVIPRANIQEKEEHFRTMRRVFEFLHVPWVEHTAKGIHDAAFNSSLLTEDERVAFFNRLHEVEASRQAPALAPQLQDPDDQSQTRELFQGPPNETSAKFDSFI